MARKGHGRPVNLVDIGTYPDDGSSPCGSNEWNANRGTVGVIGFTKKQEAISSNNINITDSYVEVTNAGTIYTMAQVTTALSSTYYPSDTSTKSFAEGDLLYLVKETAGHTVTLKHQNGGAGAGKITTLSGGDLLLDVNVPRIFICRTIGANQEWIEYGGAPATTPTDITVADESSDTSCNVLFTTAATGDLAPKSGTNLTFNSSSGVLTATGFAGPLTGNVTGDASGSAGSCTGNSATVTTNANLTGDVTSSGNATTIATDAVDIAMLSATGTASSSTFLRGDNAWAAAGGGIATKLYNSVLGSDAGSFEADFSSDPITATKYPVLDIWLGGYTDGAMDINFKLDRSTANSHYLNGVRTAANGTQTWISQYPSTTGTVADTTTMNGANNGFILHGSICWSNYQNSPCGFFRVFQFANGLNQTTSFNAWNILNSTGSIDYMGLAASANNFKAGTRMTIVGYDVS